jgi:hypothetical protein
MNFTLKYEGTKRKCIRNDNIKTDLKNTGWKSVDCIPVGNEKAQ